MKTNTITWLRRASAGLLAGGAMLLTPGCVVHEGVAYSSGPGVMYYDYDYYPEADVYFYPQGGLYYWHDGGRWLSGRSLPPRYSLHAERHEHLHYRTRQPWTERRGRH